MKDLSELHDTVTEYRIKMYEEKDAKALNVIIPLLENLIYEANQYKDWLEEI